MRYAKIEPLKAEYLMQFSGMAEAWAKAKRKQRPVISVSLCRSNRSFAHGRAYHNPPKLKLHLDEDRNYSTYLFLHELAHVWRGPTRAGESHDRTFREYLSKVVSFFNFDREYVEQKESEYTEGTVN